MTSRAHVESDTVPGTKPLSRWDIWLGQVLRDWLAGKMGAVTAAVNRKLILCISTYALSIFMVSYPVIAIVNAFRDGVLLLSIPLGLMFIGGLFTFAIADGWNNK